GSSRAPAICCSTSKRASTLTTGNGLNSRCCVIPACGGLAEDITLGGAHTASPCLPPEERVCYAPHLKHFAMASPKTRPAPPSSPVDLGTSGTADAPGRRNR